MYYVYVKNAIEQYNRKEVKTFLQGFIVRLTLFNIVMEGIARIFQILFSTLIGNLICRTKKENKTKFILKFV